MLNVVLASIDCVTSFCSFSGNGFILIMNLFAWIKNKTLTVSDQLTSGISLLEALYEVLKAWGYIYLTEINGHTDATMSLVIASTIVSSRFWFSTCLCVNFCLKIVNLKKGFYIYLQKTFPRNALWFSLLCSLASFLLSFGIGFGVAVVPSLNSSLGVVGHNVSLGLVLNTGCTLVCQAFISESLLGLLLSSSSLVAIITSLCRHMKNMQRTVNGVKSPNIGVHVQAVRTMSFLLLGRTIPQLESSPVQGEKFLPSMGLQYCFDASPWITSLKPTIDRLHHWPVMVDT
ncbi:taste receptor type 2 member 4-like [Mantella aurantiaca]